MQETTVLQNHLVRPGDVLVFYRMETVSKLAMRRGPRFYLVPVGHPSLFRTHDPANGNGPVTLADLMKHPVNYPLSVESVQHGLYVNWTDSTLPSNAALNVETLVEERCIVAAKISHSSHLNEAFHLPLRTKLTIRFENRWKSETNPRWSQWDNMAEELTKAAYKDAMSVEYEQCPAPRRPG